MPSPTPPAWTHSEDAEKGLYHDEKSLPVLAPPLAHIDTKTSVLQIETVWSPLSPVHEGITPFSSVPELSLQWPNGWHTIDATAAPTKAGNGPAPAQLPPRPKKKISKWVMTKLWFNTYRKFFTFVVLLNLAGIIMASLGRFPYAEDHLGALVLGNLLCAVLMRNEMFLRFLYIIAIYGLRSVSICPFSFCVRVPGKGGLWIGCDVNTTIRC